MKKLLSLIAMVGVLGVAGCSKSAEGTYEFDSIKMMVGEEEKKFTCTETEIEENPQLEFACPMFKTTTIELKKNGKAVTAMTGEEGDEGYSQESFYKIEDGKLLVRETEEEEWEEAGTYKDGKIVMGDAAEDGFAVVFKK